MLEVETSIFRDLGVSELTFETTIFFLSSGFMYGVSFPCSCGADVATVVISLSHAVSVLGEIVVYLSCLTTLRLRFFFTMIALRRLCVG